MKQTRGLVTAGLHCEVEWGRGMVRRGEDYRIGGSILGPSGGGVTASLPSTLSWTCDSSSGGSRAGGTREEEGKWGSSNVISTL